MDKEDWKPDRVADGTWMDRSDGWLARLFGDNLQRATLRVGIYALAVAAILATVARLQ